MAKTNGIEKLRELVRKDEEARLLDMEGKDAVLESPADTQRQVHRYAIAALPELFRRGLLLVRTSKNEKNVIEAMKFLHQLALGKVDGKQVDGIAKRLTDAELEKELEGEIVDA